MRAVLFDVAGTLLMPEDGVAWVRGGLSTLGLDAEDADVAELVGALEAAGRPGGPYPASVPDAVAPAYARRDLDEAAHREAYTTLLASVPGPDPRLAGVLYERIRSPDGWVAYADALPVLDDLRDRGVALGVVSNVGDHPEADGGAAAAGLQALVLPMTPPGGVHGLAAVLERL